jgi:hypothetical protein
MRERVLLFCLLGLVLIATIILVIAPGGCHDATGMERHDKDKSQQKKRALTPLWAARLLATGRRV